MSRTSNYQRKAQCPYFEDIVIGAGNCLKCSDVPDKKLGFRIDCVTIRFAEEDKPQDYFELFCGGNYTACPFYRMWEVKPSGDPN